MSHVTLLIPAYKPTPELSLLIQELQDLDDSKLFKSIVIVDDGSGYDYRELFDELQLINNVTIVHHAINLGKGAALKTGFNHILLTDTNITSIITADADGQHLPKDILNVARHSLKKPQALTLGVRTFSKNVPLRSLFGNQVTRLVMRFFTGLNLSDTQTGLRAWPVALAKHALKITINGYDFETEALIRAKEFDDYFIDLQEVMITTVYTEGNKSSHFNPLLDSMRIYFVFIRYCSAGLLTALTDNLIFILTYAWSGNVLYSQILSRSVGALVSFILGFHLVFRSNSNKLWALLKFISLVILFGFISYGLIQFLNQTWNIYIIFSKLLAELILFIASFAIQRDFIFNRIMKANNK
ncbi:bifunctional glycosyltransferase family 2/GtrA family protein [Candidatus Venteria ishoeyi]|uniref:N-glycosyltransferase n=1 Tax=Candidatus Venteria ishoeyi TaxID=1899563 RepID=A0A1H6F5W9_9GAMM|nr:bifunctional glycosyltransferase family 2/GtrA family protein [Candidatus Venteria ishoeyi]SEH05567.1 N-glycosyltransferase [Candidatus Venteria ishoeyi]